MTERQNYTGIDLFRLIAAFLVVTIHTSPLASYWETGDFILTRVIARVAVPFFFMTSGFFLISRYSGDAKRLGHFVKKTALIYGAAILIYLPVNLYNGYGDFRADNLLPNLIKDLVFDGTFYHLWYLPAAMLGAAIAWYLVKRLNYPKAFTAAAPLYLIGLFGDSWYGAVRDIPWLDGFYQLIFSVTDYTRNGLFFAPVFFIAGGWMTDCPRKPSLRSSLWGFAISFSLMLCEGLILRRFGFQRHDSMYLFLLPCMYFLFNLLLRFTGKRLKSLGTLSLIIYLIHPMMIIAVRLLAKITRLQALLVENSLIHFFLVSLTSLAFGLALTLLQTRYRAAKKAPNSGIDRACLEINLDNLEHNVNVLRSAMPAGCEMMAVVKADAYGHGVNEIAACIHRMGVRAFAVATVDEAIRLRRCGISGEILILGYTSPERAKELHRYELTQTLIDAGYALALENQGYALKAHLKIDTGMHRLGFAPQDVEKIAGVFAMKHIRVSGIFTHLCVCDSLDDQSVLFTRMQIDCFRQLLTRLKKKGVTIPKVHIQSSYGLLNYPELRCDYARIGIALYGVLSFPGDQTKLQLDLRPVLSLKTKVILVREIHAGDSVGYGRTFVADKKRRIAILPVGYADGYPRNLSGGRGCALIAGRRAPVVGRICMDQMAVDVTEIPDVRPGMTATLIGRDGEEEITAPATAAESESIANELLSRMGRRLTVSYRRPNNCR